MSQRFDDLRVDDNLSEIARRTRDAYTAEAGIAAAEQRLRQDSLDAWKQKPDDACRNPFYRGDR